MVSGMGWSSSPVASMAMVGTLLATPSTCTVKFWEEVAVEPVDFSMV